MLTYCYAKGKIVRLSQATVPANDLAILRGYAVFDFTRIYNGRPFHLKDHWARFNRSARELDLKVPVKLTEVEQAISDLLKKNKVKDASVRLVLTGGASVDSIAKGPAEFFILMDYHYNLPPAVFTEGARLITYELQRVLPTAKNTNYAAAVKLQKDLKKAKAVEVLYVNNGAILECSTSNFFIVKNKVIITPKDKILTGVTRQIVLRLARKKYKVEERSLKFVELKTADEAFLTASNKYVTPVVKVDEMVIGSGRVGEVTKELLATYHEEIKKECYS